MSNLSQAIEAFAYSRLSDTQQAKAGRSGLNRQHRKFQKYVVQKESEGLKIKLTPMQDIGRSAYHGKHLDDNAELGAFLGRVKNGDIKVGSWLLIEDIDRLTRQYFLAAFETTIQPLLEAGIEIHVTSTGTVLKGKLTLGQAVELLVKIDSANIYTERLSERVKGYWDQQFNSIRDGKKVNLQSRPLWISWDEEKQDFYLNDKASSIRLIFDLYLDGHGFRSIAEQLNAKGMKSLKGKQWQLRPIKNILQSPSTYGLLKYIERGLVIDDYFPAVINKSTFDIVQLLLQKRARSQVRKSIHEKDNTLQGLVFCSCGCPMYHKVLTPKKKPDGTRYPQSVASFRLCCTGKNNGAGCKTKDLYYTVVKEMLVKSSDTFNSNMSKSVEVIDHSEEIQRLELENRRILALTIKVTCDELTAQYIEMQQTNIQKIKNLKADERKPDINSALLDVKFDDLTEAEVSNSLRLIIKRVDIHSEGLGRSIFNYPDSESMPVLSVEYYNGHKQLMLMPDMRKPIAVTAYDSANMQGNMLP
ncbi:recombinase family protein [Vibrio harveyi]|uniref:recombinase family protein n=1 Tax=Vibrio harveyi TaxID=669 RepID=UPI0012636CFA|nr:recombinase family protein [Vibrio harveyi]QFQ76889.1 hypothetical protein F9277_05175 [Vibrio harveyi]